MLDRVLVATVLVFVTLFFGCGWLVGFLAGRQQLASQAKMTGLTGRGLSDGDAVKMMEASRLADMQSAATMSAGSMVAGAMFAGR